jgi:integrase
MSEVETRAPNTQRAYESDFAHFRTWCQTRGIGPLPATPEALYLYLMDLVADDNAAGYAVATVERRLAAIGAVHRSNGYDSGVLHPQVRQLMGAIRRRYGRPPNSRDRLTAAQLDALIDHLDLTTLAGLRDRAVLLFGFGSGLRRSDLAAVTIEQLTWDDDGVVVSFGRLRPAVHVGSRPGSARCPVAAVDAWVTRVGIHSGPLFRKVTRYQTVVERPLTPAAVALIVKRAAQAAHLAPDRLAAQSLRPGRPARSAQPVGPAS